MGIMKKIIATVDEKTFYNFKRRMEAENLSLGEGFSAIVSLYAFGGEIVSNKHIEKKVSESVNTYREYKKNKTSSNDR